MCVGYTQRFICIIIIIHFVTNALFESSIEDQQLTVFFLTKMHDARWAWTHGLWALSFYRRQCVPPGPNNDGTWQLFDKSIRLFNFLNNNLIVSGYVMGTTNVWRLITWNYINDFNSPMPLLKHNFQMIVG